MNLHLGGKQGVLQEGIMHQKEQPQLISFLRNYHNLELASILKEIEHVLKECVQWLERGLVLKCRSTHNGPGCDAEGGYSS